MRLEDLAWLPNHWRANVRDCLVTAAGYGDLSSERAYFRLEKLSCVRHDGRVLEQNISGSVYGEDGKLGLRGRLVTKQGQILANALLAGVVSGIGRGVVYQSSTVGTTALGTVVTDPDPGMEYQSGIGQGVSNAMDRLAQYYISLADKTHPIIEIDAGRLVDLGFTKGTALDVPLPEDPDLLAMRSGPRNGPRRVVE
jgi:conjugal transfer pilus assembly protein TraB